MLGSKNQRELRKIQPLIAQINGFEEGYRNLSDEQLRAKTDEFKSRFASGESLDALMPEAFAAVKNAARRFTERGQMVNVRGYELKWEMVHFDEQLIGGIVLHSGRIAEMGTGEGKTLVATLPVYLNALSGKGVHVVTVNDYLAARDSEWMGALYRFLGLTVGCLQHDLRGAARREQYLCDITYGTNSEFGFDYLRDNSMATTKDAQVQRGHSYAIVDEVDSILIDEARTPLIISGPAAVSQDHQFDRYKPMVERLVQEQTRMVNGILNEAEELIRAKGDPAEYGRLLYKARLGMPKSRRLLKLLEDPINRKAMEKSELFFYQDTMKVKHFELKEEMLFTIEEKSFEVNLTDKGRASLNPGDENAFTLPDMIKDLADLDNVTGIAPQERTQRKQAIQKQYDEVNERIHCVGQLLRAYCLYEKDVHYVVQENKVQIVDEFTGRVLPGRRWSDGLHQAVEAKEGVSIEEETQTYATVTIQNYFRLYKKLAGMTGTAETDAAEFKEIYKMDVVVIPPHRTCIRQDGNDVLYKTKREKYNAILREIKQAHERRQPVLVGTIAVEVSELISRMLKRDGIPHTVLNAKFHQSEAEVVARAGQVGAVTIATNMAGRGTDIKLGAGVAELGGLHVIGTERHESRRIDRQLRGRCARQGDPGSSRFFVSFEDDLMRLFGASEKMTSLMERFGFKEGEELQHPWLNKSVETAQKRVEQHHFTQRKRTLEYDDVLNQQRTIVYGYRNDILESEEPRSFIFEAVDEVMEAKITELYITEDGVVTDATKNDIVGWLNVTFPLNLEVADIDWEKMSKEDIVTNAIGRVREAYSLKEKHEDPALLKQLERYTVLSAIDKLWQEHLYGMDGLRGGIHLRGYGQRDPLVEYKKEAFEMFRDMWDRSKAEIVSNIFRSATSLMAFEKFLSALPQKMIHQQVSAFGDAAPEAQASGAGAPKASGETVTEAIKSTPIRRDAPKINRNDPCPKGKKNDQGNVLKFKNCCGKEGLESCKFH
nr:preprotein translocase subunit SecA [Oscillatoria laete-virens]